MKTSVWRYRLLQLSPLIVIALMAAVWFSLPLEERHYGISPLYSAIFPPEVRPTFSVYETRVGIMEAMLREKKGLEPWADLSVTSSMRAIDSMARVTSTKLAGIDPDVCDDNGVVRPLSAEEQEQAFAGIEVFEDAYDAEVAVFAISTDPEPGVALSAVGDPAILTDEERAAIDGDGTVEGLRRLALKRKTGVLWVDFRMIGGSVGEALEGRYVSWSTMRLDDRFWEMYAIAPEGAYGDMMPSGMGQSLSDPEFRQAMDAKAQSSDGAVLVVGPLDSGTHLIRVPQGVDAADASSLWDVLPGWRFEQALYQPTPLDHAARTALGGAGLVELALVGTANAPRLAVFALYDGHPREPALWAELGRSPLTVAHVWLGTYLWLVMAVLAVLLIVSFAASPLAFRAERIYRETLEAERERARVQREAELRVVSKLDELSARVESVKETASDATVASVSGVAEDIDSTVAELRKILGDVVGKGNPDE